MLIGLTGRAGAGKDTVADILVATFRYHKYSMAKPLKDIAEIFGFTKDQLYKNKEVVDEFWGITPRSFLQMVGTDLFRTHWRSDVWVKLAEKNTRPLLESGRNVVIPDIRFDDEALFVIKMLTYIFCYVYLCNAFKNLIKAYPKNVAFRVIYYILRFEFAKALPSYWKPILERLNQEFDKKEEENKNGSTN